MALTRERMGVVSVGNGSQEEKPKEWEWTNQYVGTHNVGRYAHGGSPRDQYLIERYRELHHLALSYGARDIEGCVTALATLEHNESIRELNHKLEYLFSNLPKNTEKIITTERVVVGDVINETMSEVYK